jgi:heterodisulfide reductase subunit A
MVNQVNREPAALVLGAGIAGMQAALDIADAGFKVYLVEREPSIGGRMSQLDKTFPTLDCSSCIMTPKMVDVSRHPNIELMTYSEIESVRGEVGAFRVQVRQKARGVDFDTCTGCGVCQDKCPKRVPSEFDMGVGLRKAIYTPFPQAVPNVPVIDRENCIWFQRGKCRVCERFCPTGAIDYEQEHEFMDIEVDTIVVATGFDPFDPRRKPELGWSENPGVVSGLEFERLVSASGPTAGKIEIKGVDEIKDVVFIKCVGSRDRSIGNPWCSRVCCMYTAKQAHLVHDRLPDANVTVFYMDVRAFGKGYEEFYDRVRKEGIIYRRGSVSEIYKRRGRLVVRAEDTLSGRPVAVKADLVVLATGLTPRADAPQIAEMLGLKQSTSGFFAEAHAKLRPDDSGVPGIYLAGTAQGPKDIPDTVSHAKGAAASAIVLLSRARRSLARQTEPLGVDALVAV